MDSGEIINLQFGNFSNYVGAHWFNSQVSIFGEENEFDGNVLWKKPYHPRLVAVDFKSNCTRHRKKSAKAKEESETAEANWDGPVEKCEEEEEVESKENWTDIISWDCEKIFLPNSSSNTLEHFSQGRLLFSSVEEQLEDGVRSYAEQCDRLQGLHVLSDMDGFGGLTERMLQLLSDDYEKKTLVSFALAGPSMTNFDHSLRTMNAALLINSLNNHCSLFSCLSPFQKLFQQSLVRRDSFQGSDEELFGLTLETLTAPYCLKRESVSPIDVAGLLNAYGRKFTALSAIIPMNTDMSLFESLNENGLPLRSLTPSVEIELSNTYSNFIVPRGFSNILPKNMERRAISTAKGCVQLFADEMLPNSVNIVAPVHTSTHRGSCIVAGHNSADVGSFLESLVSEAANKRTMKMSRAVLTKCDVMEFDEYNECLDEILTLQQKYK